VDAAAHRAAGAQGNIATTYGLVQHDRVFLPDESRPNLTAAAGLHLPRFSASVNRPFLLVLGVMVDGGWSRGIRPAAVPPPEGTGHGRPSLDSTDIPSGIEAMNAPSPYSTAWGIEALAANDKIPATVETITETRAQMMTISTLTRKEWDEFNGPTAFPAVGSWHAALSPTATHLHVWSC
jgi:hypothetical protein